MAATLKHSLNWAGYKFASTVLDDIWPQIVFFTGLATMVTTVNKLTTIDMSINSTMLTVLGTIVSLVVSFKTNNSYGRWWEGRNVWSSITTNSRQLAMLIWLQIPNLPKEKDEKKGEPHRPESKGFDIDTIDVSSTTIHPERKWHKKGEKAAHDIEAEPLLAFKDEGKMDDTLLEKNEQDIEIERRKKEKQILGSIIEKKTYIGLIQAFAVAMKHSLRGEKGPFYSDLYSLIAFLPKYNPSAMPPVTRDNLLVLWQHGIPRQKAQDAEDIYAVPLTQPAAFDGYAFEALGRPPPSTKRPLTDKEASPAGITTTSTAFKERAIASASKYVRSQDPDVIGFAKVDREDHSLRHDSLPGQTEKDSVTITTIELMPARHPPPVKIWDFFPPFRIFKIVWDWFKTKKRQEQEEERVKGGKRRRKLGAVKSEIPQEILMYLSAYVADTANRGAMGTSFLSPIMTALNELQKAMSDLDKLATTPIPAAYAFHLRLTVWAYLAFLPFQLYEYIGWVTIPATAVASMTYLGFLEIGGAIEMPFGYDDSDLDLDKFVMKISQQLAEVTAFPTAIPTQHIVLSHLNQPFLPSLSLSAHELMGVDEPRLNPTTMGFAAAYPDDKADKDKALAAGEGTRPLPKSVRDVEMALNANWKEIGDETKKFIGRQRDQLENRTGMEVAVLAL